MCNQTHLERLDDVRKLLRVDANGRLFLELLHSIGPADTTRTRGIEELRYGALEVGGDTTLLLSGAGVDEID